MPRNVSILAATGSRALSAPAYASTVVTTCARNTTWSARRATRTRASDALKSVPTATRCASHATILARTRTAAAFASCVQLEPILPGGSKSSLRRVRLGCMDCKKCGDKISDTDTYCELCSDELNTCIMCGNSRQHAHSPHSQQQYLPLPAKKTLSPQ